MLQLIPALLLSRDSTTPAPLTSAPAFALMARQGCPAGQTSCTNYGNGTAETLCVDTQTDIMHCGMCGSSCRTAGAPASCVGGQCLCGGEPACYGYCPNYQTDRHHCGECEYWVSPVLAVANSVRRRGRVRGRSVCTLRPRLGTVQHLPRDRDDLR